MNKRMFLGILTSVLLLVGVNVWANEETPLKKPSNQNIENEKSYTSINLNSKVKPDEETKNQKIRNNGSWFNININRHTYKIYCKEE